MNARLWSYFPPKSYNSASGANLYSKMSLLESGFRRARCAQVHPRTTQEMLRGLPEEELSKLQLQRDKLYLLLGSEATDSQAAVGR